ncbi:MAG TPA: AAA family ATPase [Acidimicrobiales bacterium]|nr:AAA family ATPase [Acidimicrobiales bacterium]
MAFEELLLERDGALGAIGACLAQAASGMGSVVLIGGEAGVGKSAVCRAAVRDAARRGLATWSGACDALSTPQPLGPFLEVAAQAGEGAVLDVLRGAPNGHEVMASFVKWFKLGGPSLLVLEDLHWADEASLDLLRQLGRRAQSWPVVLLVTYRDDELDEWHPLRRALGDLSGGERLVRLVLYPLSPAAVATLAAEHDVDAQALFRLTEGNPFFVTEVLASGDGLLPPAVRDAVLARAARLSRPAREVLEAMAVIPLRAEIELLGSLCPGSERAIEECQRKGMLVSDNTGLRFRHELARTAIESDLVASKAVQLHRKVLAWLRNREEAQVLPRLVHHAVAAGDAGSVLELAPRAAARASALGAHREAAAYYGAAVLCANQLGLAELANLLCLQARECHRSDEPAAALNLYKRALAIWDGLGNTARVGETLSRMANCLTKLGRGAEALEAADRALVVLEALPPGKELAQALLTRGGHAMRRSDHEDFLRYTPRALCLAEELGDQGVALGALMNLRSMAFYRGEDPGGQLLNEAIGRARDAGMVEHVAVAMMNLANAHLQARDHGAAASSLDAAIAYNDQYGFDVFVGAMRADRARLALETGDLTAAAGEATEVLRRYQAAETRASALAVLGLVRARRGDPGVWEALDEACRIAERAEEVQSLGPAAAARLEAAVLLSAGLEGAVGLAITALRVAQERSFTWLCGELHTWLERAGRPQRVRSELALPWRLELDGDPCGAAEAWRMVGCPYEAAMAVACAKQVGDDARRAAVRELHALGAGQAASQVSRRLRDLGVRQVPRGARRATAANPWRLTARETEVLGLLARRQSTSEMAAALVVSPRTVEHHVAAIFDKLGVHTRHDAVQLAGARGVFGTAPER